MDVHRAKFFGRCERSTGIEPFNRRIATPSACSGSWTTARRIAASLVFGA
jgi:hypothetical protein